MRQRQLDFERRPAALGLADLDPSPVGGHHRTDDGQAEPGATAVTAATRVSAIERFEYASEVTLGEPRSVIRDGHAPETVIGRDGDLDPRLLGGVHEGIAHEIAHHLA